MAKTTTSKPSRHKSTSSPSHRRRSTNDSTSHTTKSKKKSSTPLSPPKSKSVPARRSTKSKDKSTSTRGGKSDDYEREGGRRGEDRKGRAGKIRKEESDISMDSVESLSEHEGKEGSEGSGGSEDIEEGGSSEDSDSSEGEEEVEITKKKKPRTQKGEKKSGGKGQAQEGSKSKKEMSFVVNGKTLTSDQVQLFLKSLEDKGKELVKAGITGKEGEIGDQEGMGEEAGEGKEEVIVELDVSDEEDDDYEDTARQYRKDLESQLQIINDSDMCRVKECTADYVLQTASNYLEKSQGQVILAEYKQWSESESTYRTEIRTQWDALVIPLTTIKENQKRLIKEIQAASEERMSVLAAARKAFTAKSREHEAEIEGLQIEMDKSQKKSVKAYKKYTDEEAITKDMGMKLQDAVTAFIGDGKKRKAREDEDEDEDEEEENGQANDDDE